MSPTATASRIHQGKQRRQRRCLWRLNEKRVSQTPSPCTALKVPMHVGRGHERHLFSCLMVKALSAPSYAARVLPLPARGAPNPKAPKPETPVHDHECVCSQYVEWTGAARLVSHPRDSVYCVMDDLQYGRRRSDRLERGSTGAIHRGPSRGVELTELNCHSRFLRHAHSPLSPTPPLLVMLHAGCSTERITEARSPGYCQFP